MPCTMHAKKRALPEFSGYTREEEDRLQDFALEELYHLLHHKRQARYFSTDMQLLADPEFDPPTPPPKKRKTKRQVPKQPPRAAAAMALSPRPQGDAAGEVPQLPSSPFRQRSRSPSVVASPPMQHRSENMMDFSAFFEQDEED